jgi:hypothetical protein
VPSEATITVLYTEGKDDEYAANAPFVELRKWEAGLWERAVDYVIEYGRWAPPCRPESDEDWFPARSRVAWSKARVIHPASDGEAIRQAIRVYDELKNGEA